MLPLYLKVSFNSAKIAMTIFRLNISIENWLLSTWMNIDVKFQTSRTFDQNSFGILGLDSIE